MSHAHTFLSRALRARGRQALQSKPSAHGSNTNITIKSVDWWSRAIPLSHGKHAIGYASTWPGQALLPVESHLELRILKALTACDECIALATQPATIHYLANGSARSYTPDILAAYVSPGMRQPECVLIEVKTDTNAYRYRFKLEERQRAVQVATAMPLLILTESDLANTAIGEGP